MPRPLAILTLQAAKAPRALEAFRRAGFEVESIPLIEPRPLPEADILASLEGQPLAEVRGAILTSATAAEEAARLLQEAPTSALERLRDLFANEEFPLLAVGEATARACRSSFGRKRVHAAAGGGQKGVFGLLRSGPGWLEAGRLWWMPCSRQASPDLAERVAEAGARVLMSPLYEPAPSPEGRECLRERLERLALEARPAWLAFFSPSAVEAWAEEKIPANVPANVRIAAAGSTTAGAWTQAFGEAPDFAGLGLCADDLAKALAGSA